MKLIFLSFLFGIILQIALCGAVENSDISKTEPKNSDHKTLGAVIQTDQSETSFENIEPIKIEKREATISNNEDGELTDEDKKEFNEKEQLTPLEGLNNPGSKEKRHFSSLLKYRSSPMYYHNAFAREGKNYKAYLDEEEPIKEISKRYIGSILKSQSVPQTFIAYPHKKHLSSLVKSRYYSPLTKRILPGLVIDENYPDETYDDALNSVNYDYEDLGLKEVNKRHIGSLRGTRYPLNRKYPYYNYYKRFYGSLLKSPSYVSKTNYDKRFSIPLDYDEVVEYEIDDVVPEVDEEELGPESEKRHFSSIIDKKHVSSLMNKGRRLFKRQISESDTNDEKSLKSLNLTNTPRKDNYLNLQLDKRQRSLISKRDLENQNFGTDLQANLLNSPMSSIDENEEDKRHLSSLMQNKRHVSSLFQNSGLSEDKRNLRSLLDDTNKRHLSSLIQNKPGSEDQDEYYSSILENDYVKRYFGSLLQNKDDMEKRHLSSLWQNKGYDLEKKHFGSLLDSPDNNILGSLLDDEGNIDKRHFASLIDKKNIASLIDKKNIASLIDKKNIASLIDKRHFASLLDNSDNKRHFGSLLDNSQDFDKRHFASLLDSPDNKRHFGSLLDNSQDFDKRHFASLLDSPDNKRHFGSLLDNSQDFDKRHFASLLDSPDNKRHFASLLDNSQNLDKRHFAFLLDSPDNKRHFASLLDNNQDFDKRHFASLLDSPGYKRHFASLLDNSQDFDKRHFASLLDNSDNKRHFASLLDNSQDFDKRHFASLLDNSNNKRHFASLLDNSQDFDKRYLGSLLDSNRNNDKRHFGSLLDSIGTEDKRHFASLLDSTNMDKKHLGSLLDSQYLDKRHFSSLIDNLKSNEEQNLMSLLGKNDNINKRYFGSVLDNSGNEEKRHYATLLDSLNNDKRHFGSLLDNKDDIDKRHFASLLQNKEAMDKRHLSALLQNKVGGVDSNFDFLLDNKKANIYSNIISTQLNNKEDTDRLYLPSANDKYLSQWSNSNEIPTNKDFFSLPNKETYTGELGLNSLLDRDFERNLQAYLDEQNLMRKYIIGSLARNVLANKDDAIYPSTLLSENGDISSQNGKPSISRYSMAELKQLGNFSDKSQLENLSDFYNSSNKNIPSKRYFASLIKNIKDISSLEEKPSLKIILGNQLSKTSPSLVTNAERKQKRFFTTLLRDEIDFEKRDTPLPHKVINTSSLEKEINDKRHIGSIITPKRDDNEKNQILDALIKMKKSKDSNDSNVNKYDVIKEESTPTKNSKLQSDKSTNNDKNNAQNRRKRNIGSYIVSLDKQTTNANDILSNKDETQRIKRYIGALAKNNNLPVRFASRNRNIFGIPFPRTPNLLNYENYLQNQMMRNIIENPQWNRGRLQVVSLQPQPQNPSFDNELPGMEENSSDYDNQIDEEPSDDLEQNKYTKVDSNDFSTYNNKEIFKTSQKRFLGSLARRMWFPRPYRSFVEHRSPSHSFPLDPITLSGFQSRITSSSAISPSYPYHQMYRY